MKPSSLILAASALLCVAGPAVGAPRLEATSLYKDMAHGCRTLDLKQWSHPTRGVLEKADVGLRKVELCNEDRYPIFHVAIRYDPNGPNDHYYNKLYAELAAANGYHSFALVDAGWEMIFEVAVKGKKELDVSYEEFTLPKDGK